MAGNHGQLLIKCIWSNGIFQTCGKACFSCVDNTSPSVTELNASSSPVDSSSAPPPLTSLYLRRSQPVSEEFQNGEGFGYIVAFRANGTRGWKEKMVTSADSTMYKYRDETFPPLTAFEVKVGVYNNKGDGPFSRVVVIHSAEGGESSGM